MNKQRKEDKMIATTVEQSKHLFELGLNPDSADMFWMDTNSVKPCLNLMDDGIFNHRNYLVRFPNTSLPAWSLSALLEVMPSFIDYKGQKLRLTIEKAGIWNVFYLGTEHRLNEIWFNGEYGEPVEPAYKMVCWLLRNNLIEKG